MKFLQDNIDSEDLSNRKFDRGAMLKDLEDRANAVVFINSKISEHFIAAPGSLIVIPSMTNNGKSTLTAAISEALVNTNKKVLVLSNEEKEEDVRARVSCLRQSVSFGDYKTNRCSKEQVIKVLDDAEELANNAQLVVISPQNEADAFKVTTVEGVIGTLEKAKGKFDAVIIDYYTNVNVGTNGSMDPWHVNNHFATELNTFKNNKVQFVSTLWGAKNNSHSDNQISNSGKITVEDLEVVVQEISKTTLRGRLGKGGKKVSCRTSNGVIELIRLK